MIEWDQAPDGKQSVKVISTWIEGSGNIFIIFLLSIAGESWISPPLPDWVQGGQPIRVSEDPCHWRVLGIESSCDDTDYTSMR